jgi:hypothetical protein
MQSILSLQKILLIAHLLMSYQLQGMLYEKEMPDNENKNVYKKIYIKTINKDSKYLENIVQKNPKSLTKQDVLFAIQLKTHWKVFIPILKTIIEHKKELTLSSILQCDATSDLAYVRSALYLGITPTPKDIKYAQQQENTFCEDLFTTIVNYLNTKDRLDYIQSMTIQKLKNEVMTFAFWQNHKEPIEYFVAHKKMSTYDALCYCYKYNLTNTLDTVLAKFSASEEFRMQYSDYIQGSYYPKSIFSCYYPQLDTDEEQILNLYISIDKKSDEFSKIFIQKFKHYVPLSNGYQTL